MERILPGFWRNCAASDKIKVVPTPATGRIEIINKEIRAAIEIPAEFQDDVAHQKSATLLIHNYEGDMKSAMATDNVQKSLEKYRDRIVHDNLAAKNLPEAAFKPFEIKEHNVAPPEKVGGAAFGGVIGYMVILLCITGCMYPAMDLTAGEKERGTMETILSSPIARVDLVFGKFFLVLTTALVTAALSVTSMGVSFAVLGHLHAFDKAGADASAQLQLHIGFTQSSPSSLWCFPLRSCSPPA